ncbi:hypothetical protein F5I97DRAFT_1958330 [Phlebopus sp. FC_14]|nr:hypothetical protein F5I97DRAFT_1958330 [Phlebopus sp. FC_14]
MANVVYPPVDFFHSPSNHAPSRFGFGFGLPGNPTPLGGSKQTPLTPGHTQPAAFQQLTSHMNLPAQRVQKRRHEPEDDGETGRQGLRDITMDRSPTPERAKRAAPKRAKVVPHGDGKEDKGDKGPDGGDEVDVGVLLGALPAQSLLPLLNAMIDAQPSLKTLILPLIPRPSVEMAIQALDECARKLREAYPYSTVPTFSSACATTSLGFGFGSQRCGYADDSARPGYERNDGLGDGSAMRESYVLSRLRPHIEEFVSTCMSYVPYFSYNSGRACSRWGGLEVEEKEKLHPSEAFLFLSTVTGHITTQPAVTQASLGRILLPRLAEEWMGWVERIDEVVNREGGMFGGENVRIWEKTLDEFAGSTAEMGRVRDRWVARVGWLVGRNVLHSM